MIHKLKNKAVNQVITVVSSSSKLEQRNVKMGS